MVSCRRIVVGRKANVSMEFVLSTMLGVMVLILVLGLFNQNLATMANSGGINNIYNRDKITEYKGANKDYSGSGVNAPNTSALGSSEVFVPTLGSQGLEWYISEALKTIDKIAALPQPLTSRNDQLDFAEALTILNAAKPEALNDSIISLKNQNAIKTTIKRGLEIQITTPNDNFNFSVPNTIDYSQPNNEKITNIKTIQDQFKTHENG